MSQNPKTTREWDMVVELYKVRDEFTSDDAVSFIENLYEHLDPHAPFAESVEGDPDRQFRWLNCLYERYCNLDEESAQEWWDD